LGKWWFPYWLLIHYSKFRVQDGRWSEGSEGRPGRMLAGVPNWPLSLWHNLKVRHYFADVKDVFFGFIWRGKIND
jgi:hypothetical protein